MICSPVFGLDPDVEGSTPRIGSETKKALLGTSGTLFALLLTGDVIIIRRRSLTGLRGQVTGAGMDRHREIL